MHLPCLFRKNSHAGILTRQNAIGDRINTWGLDKTKRKTGRGIGNVEDINHTMNHI
jgi:hypothetical protein